MKDNIVIPLHYLVAKLRNLNSEDLFDHLAKGAINLINIIGDG